MKLDYSFDDEPVRKFSYSLYKKRMEVSFEGYYDLVQNTYLKNPCTWILENWEYGRGCIGNETKLYDSNKIIGIISLILYMKYNDNGELEMLVNTVDNRYITLYFKNPKLALKL